jgi:DNA polymerase III delta prime subunit
MGDIVDLQSRREAERTKLLVKATARLMSRIAEARESPAGLYKLIFLDDRGEPVTIKWFHEEWFTLLMENRNLLLEAPRGCGKTTWLICVILWLLGRNQELRIKLVCENDGKAKKRLRAIRDFIKDNELYQLVFPDVKIATNAPNDKHTLNLVRNRITPESTIEAKGIDTAGAGDRADIFFGDDICGYRNTLGKVAMREEVKETFLNDWKPTINPRDGRFIMIFTPWHEEDLNSHLRRTTNWMYKRYAHGKPNNPYYSIFPELFPPSKLMQERVSMGSVNYARAYLCQAITGDTVIVQAEWIQPYDKRHLKAKWLKSAHCIISADPASGRKAHQGKLDFAAFSVFLILDPAITGFKHTLILVAESFQCRATTAQQVCILSELCGKWRPHEILIEAQGMQNLHEWVMRDQAQNPSAWTGTIIPIPATQAKGQRLEAITPLMDTPEGVPPFVRYHPKITSTTQESFFHRLNDGSQVECERALRHQMVNFPTKHDDNLDSCTQGLNYIKAYYLPVDEDNPDSNTGFDSISIDF